VNKQKLVFCFLVLFSLVEIKASISLEKKDSIRPNCKKIATTISLSTAAVGSQALLYSLWYAPYSSGKFHFFNDWNEWRKMDKLGHAYTAYHVSSATYDALSWSGYSQSKSLLIASSASWLYQGFIEVMDGFSDGWGFSVPDVIFNSIGTGLFVFEKKFKKPVLLPKFSYSPSPYAILRPEVLGSSSFSRILKDYNAQTYWLGIRANSFIPSLNIKWLMLSVGYSVNGHLVGDKLSVNLNGNTYNSYTQILVSLDIDPSALPIRNKLLKKIVLPLKYIKIPFPTLGIENGNVKFYPIYF
jgi:hypothetical protein